MNTSTHIPEMQLRFEDYQTPGLYLIFKDHSRLALTESLIHTVTERYMSDPSKIPDLVKKAVDYQPCRVCPERTRAKICHALKPMLPFLDIVDRYSSFEEVLCVYKAPDSDILYTAQTTMQRALQHISILSLIYYCEVGRQYTRYFTGVIPLMPPHEFVVKVYQNIYLHMRGDMEKVKALIQTMRDEITVTAECQIKRMHLICKHDAFINAFVNTQISTEFLKMNTDKGFWDIFGS